jgi:LysR family transcriptional regulator, hydrogen peroxide-inducible genes activator
VRGKGGVQLAALRGESVLLLDEGHCFREQTLELCTKAGAGELGFRATSLSTLVQMVAAGSGVTLLPEIAVELENRSDLLAVRPFCAPVPYRTIVLAFRKRSGLRDALCAIAAEARTAFEVTRARPRTKRRRANRAP